MPSAPVLSRWRFHLGALILLASGVLVSGWPVLTGVFGYNDDYHLLLRAQRGELGWFQNEFTEGGRYILSPIMVWAYSQVEGVAGLSSLRAAGLIGGMLLSVGLYLIFFRALATRREALAAALFVTLTPATATWLGWAACLTFPYVALVAFLAGYWTWNALQAPWTARTAGAAAASAVTLLLCFCVYQPNATFWIVGFWLGHWFAPQEPPGEATGQRTGPKWRGTLPLIAGPALMVGTAAVYFLLFRFLAKTLDLQGQTERGATALSDLPAQLVWLVPAYGIRIIASWGQLVSTSAGLASALICAVPILAALWLRYRRPIPFAAGLLITLSALLLSLLPMIGAADRAIAFRVMGPPMAIVSVLVFEGMRRTLARGRLQRWVPAALLLCALGNAVLFHGYLKWGMVKPWTHEYAAIGEQIDERLATFPTHLVYRFPPETAAPLSLFTPSGEFGKLSSYQKWVIPAFLQLLLEERFGRNRPQVTVSSRHLPWVTPRAPVVSALEAVAGPPLETVDDPFWGRIKVYPRGWIDSAWFGVLNNARFPEIQHAEHHYLFCNPREAGSDEYWFLDWQTKRWFSTTAATYPTVFFDDIQETWEYRPVVAPLRAFHNAEKDAWMTVF